MTDEIQLSEVEDDEYVIFSIGSEMFAFEIFKVSEVMNYIPITELPRMPAYLHGVVNLRGDVVSVIDLRHVSGFNITGKTADEPVIIAVESEHQGEIFQIGVLADAVENIHRFPSDQIGIPPEFGMKIDPEFVSGAGKLDRSRRTGQM